MVDIKGLDKARVLKALYDHSHVQGRGVLQAVPEGLVTVEYCAGLLEKQTYFDYLHGRVLKVELSGDEFDGRLYDLDCGEGAAQRAVDSIKEAPEGGEKKELTLEEKQELAKDAVEKVLGILEELPPDSLFAASMALRMILGGGTGMGMLSGIIGMSGPFMKPMGGPIERPFPFKGRFG